MILTIIHMATVSKRHASPSHASTQAQPTQKTNETVLTSNKMSNKYFCGIRNKRAQKETSDGRVSEERPDMK